MCSVCRGPAPLCVEIRCVRRYFCFRVGDLVRKEREILIALVGERDLGVPAEGHWPEAIQSGFRIHNDSERVHRREQFMTHGEEVRYGDFDGWRGFVVPIEAQYAGAADAPEITRGDHPDVLNDAWAIDIHDGDSLAGFWFDEWPYLPSLTEPNRGL